MARNKDIFNAIAGVPNRNAINQPKRTPIDMDPTVTTGNLDPLPAGEGAGTPGVGGGSIAAGMLGSLGIPGGSGISNMNEAYDFWYEGLGDSFYDWWMGQTGMYDEWLEGGWNADWQDNWGHSGNPGYSPGQGGASGGAGDIGYGNMFGGGQFGSQGWGEGYQGWGDPSGDSFWENIDTDLSGDFGECMAQFQQIQDSFGDADWAVTWSQFAAENCPEIGPG